MFGIKTRKVGSIGGCPRSWAAYYLERVRPEYLPEALVFGIKFHKACASLVSTGRMPDLGELQPGVVLTEFDVLPESIFGKMARAAVVHLPRSTVPETGDVFRNWEVEAEWIYEWTTSHGLVTEIDLRPDVCSDEPLVHLVDWKSTGDKRNALKRIDDDVQANLYAVGLMRRFDREHVLGRWVYVEKKGKHNSWPIDSMFHRESSEQWLHNNVDRTIELIHMMREHKPKAMDLPGDEEACQGTGRWCDYEGTCLGQLGARPGLIPLEDIVRFKNS
jgi:hypothetical protein